MRINGISAEIFGAAWLQEFLHRHVTHESTYEYEEKGQAAASVTPLPRA